MIVSTYNKIRIRRCPILEDIKEKGQILLPANVINMLITSYFLKTYSSFFRIFNNITRLLYITNINISNNRIGRLPKEFGTLFYLQRLNLSQNCLKRFGWSWLNQVPIKKTLLSLDISYNALPELSEHIWKLSALIELNVSNNVLKHLPPGIETARNLRILDLSHNKFIYILGEIINLKLQSIDISMNPLLTIREEYLLADIRIQSLVQLAAKTLRQSARISFISEKWNELINRTIQSCFFCGNVCTIRYRCAVVSEYELRSINRHGMTTTQEAIIRKLSSEIPGVQYELCYCYPECPWLELFINELDRSRN